MLYDTTIYYRQVMQRFHSASQPQVPVEFIDAVIATFEGEADTSLFACFPIEVLVEYIRRSHVFYLTAKLPEIGQSILSLSAARDGDIRLLLLLEASFTAYYRKLDTHIREEERLLLPYIEELCLAVQGGIGLIGRRNPGNVSLLDIFERTHSDTEADLAQMRAVIDAYHPSATDNSPYRILLSQLESFESDLKVHAFIEDEILVPRARRLEGALLRPATPGKRTDA